MKALTLLLTFTPFFAFTSMAQAQVKCGDIFQKAKAGSLFDQVNELKKEYGALSAELPRIKEDILARFPVDHQLERLILELSKDYIAGQYSTAGGPNREIVNPKVVKDALATLQKSGLLRGKIEVDEIEKALASAQSQDVGHPSSTFYADVLRLQALYQNEVPNVELFYAARELKAKPLRKYNLEYGLRELTVIDTIKEASYLKNQAEAKAALLEVNFDLTAILGIPKAFLKSYFELTRVLANGDLNVVRNQIDAYLAEALRSGQIKQAIHDELKSEALLYSHSPQIMFERHGKPTLTARLDLLLGDKEVNHHFERLEGKKKNLEIIISAFKKLEEFKLNP